MTTATLTNSTVSTVTHNGVTAFTFDQTGITSGSLAGFRNRVINGNFGINQRVYASGAAVGASLYGHDRWKMAASADTYTFSTTANVTTITIPASKVLQQVIEGLNLETGTYILSWSGTAQGKIGAGSYGASGVTGSITGGTNTTIEFGPGTVSKVQLEIGTIATTFEQRPYGLELALCQRYYIRLNVIWANVYAYNTTSCWGKLADLPVTMRATPTGGLSSISHFRPTNGGGFAPAFTSGAVDLTSPNFIGTSGGWIGSSGLTANAGAIINLVTPGTGWIDASAEL